MWVCDYYCNKVSSYPISHDSDEPAWEKYQPETIEEAMEVHPEYRPCIKDKLIKDGISFLCKKYNKMY